MRKRNGENLSPEDIKILVDGISTGSMPDYQVAAWAMAVFFQGMSDDETTEITLAMANSGEMVDLSGIKGIKVDKHSTGGVGDKTTLVVLPLVAAAGVPVAKMSGRGLGHTGGTIDKLESIPGFLVELDYNIFIEQVNNVRAAIVSQTGNLVPADKRLYAIRDVTATIDSIPLIASSVMSKKIAAGAQGIILDVKVGKGAFIKDVQQARALAYNMVRIGQGVGRQVRAVLSNMDQPLGKAIGNALEVKEAIDTLKGVGPVDVEELSIQLAAHMLVLGGKFNRLEEAVNEVKKILVSGQGLDKFLEMITAQGGKLDLQDRNYGLPYASLVWELTAPVSGYVHEIDALEVGKLTTLLGGGRELIGDLIDYSVGIELLKKQGDYVQAGESLALLHGKDEATLEIAMERLRGAYKLAVQPVKPDALIIDTIGD